MWRSVVVMCAAALIAPKFGGAQRVARDTGVIRDLIEEARTAIAAAPQQSDDRAARLASTQARLGNIAGARETARLLGHTWVAFGYVAIAQHDSGDLAGAIETANLASSLQDRSQALGYLASALAYSGKIDSALSIARTIAWPYQRVEELKLAATLLGGKDVPRTRQLLREAVDVARADTSSWGRYFEVDLAYEQAGAGDFTSAFRVLSDTLPPETRAERLGRMAFEARRAPVAEARAIADSLFRAALRSADAVADTTLRKAIRARVHSVYGIFPSIAPTATIEAEANSPSERAMALSLRARGAGNVADRSAALAELERVGEYHRVVDVLVFILWELRVSTRWPNASSSPAPSNAETLVSRAIADAAHVSNAFADSTQMRVVSALVRPNARLARELTDGIRNDALRSTARIDVANEWLFNDVDTALAYARSAAPSNARDDFYVSAVRRLTGRNTAAALSIARTIDDPSRRGLALVSIASALRTDSAGARAVYAEALPQLDASGRGFEPVYLIGLYSMGGVSQLREWARSQPTAERRAAAFAALLAAVVR